MVSVFPCIIDHLCIVFGETPIQIFCSFNRGKTPNTNFTILTACKHTVGQRSVCSHCGATICGTFSHPINDPPAPQPPLRGCFQESADLLVSTLTLGTPPLRGPAQTLPLDYGTLQALTSPWECCSDVTGDIVGISDSRSLYVLRSGRHFQSQSDSELIIAPWVKTLQSGVPVEAGGWRSQASIVGLVYTPH